jgi:hypothetical protein
MFWATETTGVGGVVVNGGSPRLEFGFEPTRRVGRRGDFSRGVSSFAMPLTALLRCYLLIRKRQDSLCWVDVSLG